MAADRLVVAVATGEPDDLDVRVARQEADELRADVAGRADDPDADPSRAAVGGDAPFGAGGPRTSGPSRSPRATRVPRSRAHAVPARRLSREVGLGWLAGIGWTVVMGA